MLALLKGPCLDLMDLVDVPSNDQVSYALTGGAQFGQWTFNEI